MAKKNRNDQISTPYEYVEEMLDRIGYVKNLVGKTILENSCGQGNILVPIVNRYIKDAKIQGLSNEHIAERLSQDIIGFEINQGQRTKCIESLDKICSSSGIENVRWNIMNQDFLTYNVSEIKASFIVGNPPYITYHDMPEEERLYLKEHYEVCKKGRFDYCYAFIEASIKALKSDGKMIYLIPFSIFRNRYAKELRKFIVDGMTGVVDLSGEKVFPGITCSVAFLLYESGKNSDKILYEESESGIQRMIQRSHLCEDNKKWIFQKVADGEEQFDNYFDVYNSVATLLNEAFLIKPTEEDEHFFYIEGWKVEKGICLKAISTKSEKKKRAEQPYIIFPYKREGQEISNYNENEFKRLYPHAYQYLIQFEEKLKDRKSDKNAQWFEYGRSQALRELWREKLVLPMVITKQVRVYWGDESAVPYAGYFITQKKDSAYTLEDAVRILQSMEFYQYVKMVGTPTTETSYRVSVNDIKQYRFK
ncbi:MAG: SAM-dependent methyltransferase [Hungatella sp.]|nr:SAM-dependent methyltransferase [Hungatella sp.]